MSGTERHNPLIAISSEWQIALHSLFLDKPSLTHPITLRAAHALSLSDDDVLQLLAVAAHDVAVLQLQSAPYRHVDELALLFDAEVSPAGERGGDASGATAREGVENPRPMLRRGEDDAHEERQGLLGGMLALRLLPSGDGGQSPHVGHLLAIVELLHEVVVEVVRHLLLLPRPDHELGAVGEVTAGDVGWRIGLRPGDDVEDFEAQLRELVGYREDVVVGARNPDGAVLLEVVTATGNPLLVEVVDVLGRTSLVPVALVDAHHLSALHGDAAVGEEVRGIGEDHVELEVKFAHQPHAVALEEGEVGSHLPYAFLTHHLRLQR